MTYQLFPKPESDKTAKRRARTERRKDTRKQLIIKYGCKCQASLVAHKYYDGVDTCHIVRKRANAKHLDIPENCILLCRQCHNRFDKDIKFRQWVLNDVSMYKHSRRPDLSNACLYAHDKLSKLEFEDKLKQIYYQRIGETK